MIADLTIYAALGFLANRGAGGMFNEILCRLLRKPPDATVIGTVEGHFIYGAILALLAIHPERHASSSELLWFVFGATLLLLFTFGRGIGYFTDTDREGRTTEGFLRMTAHGMAVAAPAWGFMVMLLVFDAWAGYHVIPTFNPWPLAVGAATQGLFYMLGDRLNLNVHDLRGTELGEGLFGTALALGLYFA